ncbi:hypothetical protein KP814_32565 [Hahella sp. HN01]|nr:hypothetical protein [Hahella sp. HN01]
MKCRVCARQAKGFGHLNTRHRPGESKRYPTDWRFCSARCQKAFHALYADWLKGTTEEVMLNATDIEKAALRDCLKPFGDAATAIGFDKPLGAYSELEAMTVVEAIVSGYVAAMTQYHESARCAPVRSSGERLEPKTHLFSDLEGEVPWEKSA